MKKLLPLIATALLVAACSGSSGSDFANPAFGDVTVSGAALTPFENPNADPAVGQPAPTVSGVDPTGAAVEYSPGNPTVLMFVAHWCSHCQAEVPRVVDWVAANPDRLGVDIIAVATGTQQGQPNYPPAAWLDREEWTEPIIMDDEDATVGQSFGLTSYPFWVIVAPDGTVAARAAGELSADQIDSLMQNVAGL